MESLKKYGAEKIYAVDDADIKGYLVAPKAEVLPQLVEKTSPAAVLIPSSAEGKEIAGRLAVKTELRPDHRRGRRPADGAGDHPVRVRRQLHGAGQGHQGHADHHREAQLRDARSRPTAPAREEDFAATISDAAKKAQDHRRPSPARRRAAPS